MAQHPFTTGRWLQANNMQESENWHITRNEQNEVTSFCYVPNKDIKSIFLGTFPIYEISENNIIGIHPEFFYGSNINYFWPTLGDIFNQPFDTVQQRIELLQLANFGITDILLEIERIVPQQSDDNNLNEIRYNKFFDILTRFPKIENVYITSGGVSAVPNLNSKKNVATWFKDYCSGFWWRDIIVTGFNQIGYVKQISISDRSFNLIYLYSPSGSANTAIQAILNRNNNFGIQNMNITFFRQYQWEYFIKKYHFKQEANIPQALINFFEQ